MTDLLHRHHVCPADYWESDIRVVRALLDAEGLTPASRLLDVGAGCFRIGRSLVEFLDRGNYAAVEPCIKVCQAGVTHELGRDLVLQKNPVILHTGDFDFSPLRAPFSHVLAFDVFIHCSPRQFATFLQEVRKVTTPDSKIIVSVRIDEADRVIPKTAPSNSIEEKRDRHRYLYADAEANTTIYSQRGFDELTLGFSCRRLKQFGTKHIFSLSPQR